MQHNYTPVVSIDTIINENIFVSTNKFMYKDFEEIQLKIFLENVKLIYSDKYSTLKIQSEQLVKLKEHLLSLIQNQENQENQEKQEHENISKSVKINFTNNSKISLIPTKVSEKQKVFINTKDDFIPQIKNYYLNKFGGINANANIIITPIILKDKKGVWFEIHNGEIYHPYSHFKSGVYKRMFSVEQKNEDSEIII
jgi:hypothetical protein